MNEDTPLEDVARLLSKEAASVVLEEPQWVQESVLRSVRIFIAGLEANGVDLDPVRFEAVVDGMVAPTVIAHREVYHLRGAIDAITKEVSPWST